jgi:predicted kinase
MNDVPFGLRLMVCGKMGSGKSMAADYLVEAHHARRWSRSTRMKQLANAVAFGEPIDSMLEAVLPSADVRAVVIDQLRGYGDEYEPEPGKPRRLYQDVAEIVMMHDPLAFERELVARINAAATEGDFILIDDVRSRPAFDWYVSQQFWSIRIAASEDVRKQRMLARDGFVPAVETFEHLSETELDDVEVDFDVANEDAGREVIFTDLDEIVLLLRGGKSESGRAAMGQSDTEDH